MLRHTVSQYGFVTSHLNLLSRILVAPGRKEDCHENVVLPIRAAAKAGLKEISLEFDEVCSPPKGHMDLCPF